MARAVTDFTEHDQQIWEEELNDFLPNRIFDAHIHLYHPEHRSQRKEEQPSDWGLADLSTLKQWAARLYPGRETHFLALGTPIREIDPLSHNRWCIEQIQLDPQSRFNCLVTPSTPSDAIVRWVSQEGVVGLKPYRIFSTSGDIAQCRIHEFLTHEQMEIANERGLFVTMHLSRFHGCADEQNLSDLEEYTCRRYPKIRWILAHCARSFTYWPIRRAIERLSALPNLWYDVSAVTDVRPLITLFTREDRRRILYGSDGVDATYFHGQYAAMGRAWQAIDAGPLGLRFPHCDGRPILAIYEQLLAMKHATELAEWSREEIDGMFWRNGAELLGVRFDAHLAERDRVGNVIPPTRNRENVQELYRRAKLKIPGGTQLLSKRPEMYAPGKWPAYFRKAQGCEVIDTDGKPWIDMTTSGIGSCLLGYADPDVDEAVTKRIAIGSMSTLNVPEELELAELLIELHPWAEQVRYTRSGGEAMAVAVRIARAATGREKIAFCGYHGWSDWYLAANLTTGQPADALQGHLLPGLEPRGVPQGLAGTSFPFTYNQIDELRELVDRHGPQLAAIVMEPTRSSHPEPGFLEEVRELANRSGAVLLFDEVSSGWRMHLGGVHLRLGVLPDVAVFAKAISNGYPMAAIVGKRSIMEHAQHSFISSTYWTEGIGPAAALATVKKFQQVDLPAHANRLGEMMREGWSDLGRRYSLPVKVHGHAPLLHMGFDHPKAVALGTLVTSLMLERGFLTGSGFYPSLAHRESHMEKYFDALRETFEAVANSLRQNDVEEKLRSLGSTPRHTGFARLT